MTEEAKWDAARLYESCVFDQLLGETLRPGGLKLTTRLAEVAGISRNHLILDIACGKGTTAFFLSREYQCRVIGIDLSDRMLAICQGKVEQENAADRVSFLLGDGENLPFRDSSFDTVVSECSFSLLPAKEVAARDIGRVLKPGGKLVMTDITLNGEVSDELRSQVGFACCLAGARRAEEYIAFLERAGLQFPYIEDHSNELRKVAYQLGIAFGSVDGFVSRLPEGPCRLKGTGGSTPSLQAYQEYLMEGKPGYALIAMTKT